MIPKYPHITVRLLDKSHDLVGAVAKVSNEMYHAGAKLKDSAIFARRALDAKTFESMVSIAREYVEITDVLTQSVPMEKDNGKEEEASDRTNGIIRGGYGLGGEPTQEEDVPRSPFNDGEADHYN